MGGGNQDKQPAPNDTSLVIQGSGTPQSNREQDQKVVFLTKQDLVGPKRILYTSLDFHMSRERERGPDGLPLDLYKKRMPQKFTLVVELVDILVKVVDVNSE